MSGLVGYGSSDEEDEIKDERPAKIAKTTHHAAQPAMTADAPQLHAQINDSSTTPPLSKAESAIATTHDSPPPGPSAPLTSNPDSTSATPASAPLSPYTSERQRIQEITMPTHPNFDIPSSPPPPAPNSEEAATLAATTKKFERFLELKRQGVHFNERLEQTASLRNPSLLGKLMEFAGISQEDACQSTLEGELGVPVKWPEGWYVEDLVKVNERREKKRVGERERVEFVKSGHEKSGSSSAVGTPKSGVGGEGRRSKFNKR